MDETSLGVIDFADRRSQKLIEEGLEQFSAGHVEDALASFEESARLRRTPEALTYIGWMMSYLGRFEEAIQNCLRAIEMDPDFGNPYNDIGTYFMKMGDLAQAVPWLERAKVCKRYEPRQFPYLNLGRIYLSQGMFLKALTEFEGALEFDPSNVELQMVVRQIRDKHKKPQQQS